MNPQPAPEGHTGDTQPPYTNADIAYNHRLSEIYCAAYRHGRRDERKEWEEFSNRLENFVTSADETKGQMLRRLRAIIVASVEEYESRSGAQENARLESIMKAVSSHARLLSESARQSQRIEQLEGALKDLLFVFENADETGYVDGVGFVKGFDELPDKCRALLAASTLNQTEQK